MSSQGFGVLRRFLRDRASFLGAAIVLALVFCAIFAPILAPHPDDIYDFHTANRLKPPSWFNPFGTDRMGSDLMSRLMFGARTTLTICVIAVGVACIVGIPIGVVAGYYSGWLPDLLIDRKSVV